MSSKRLTEKLAKIDKIVEWFSGDKIDVDEALVKFDELSKLADEAKADLATLENKVSVLKQKFSD